MNIHGTTKYAVRDFVDVCLLAKVSVDFSDFEIAFLEAPHSPVDLPEGKIAVYIFSFKNQMLKIGMIGSNSNQRFRYHHYNPCSSRSNLAKSILNDEQFPIGISKRGVGDWIKENCCRVNIFIAEDKGMPLLKFLESFLHLRFLPRYEG